MCIEWYAKNLKDFQEKKDCILNIAANLRPVQVSLI